VDNGSTDGSAAFVREAFPQATLLALDSNLGFGGVPTPAFAPHATASSCC